MHFVVRDINGTVYSADPVDFEEFKAEGATVEQVMEALDAVEELLKDFKSLNHVVIKVEGDKVYFNPAHVIYVGVIDRFTEEEIRQGLTEAD